MKTRFASILAAALVLVVSTTAGAQIFTPTFTSPRLLDDLGVYLSDGPRDLAVEGIWRGGALGLRVGVINANGGLLSVGGELRAPLVAVDVPLGLALTVGAQGVFGDQGGAGVQGGLTAGQSFPTGGVVITPYIHPRIGLVNQLGGRDRLALRVLADAGADVEFWNNLVFRFGVNFSDFGSNWGAGLAIRQ